MHSDNCSSFMFQVAGKRFCIGHRYAYVAGTAGTPSVYHQIASHLRATAGDRHGKQE
jgi:hypothetical protein